MDMEVHDMGLIYSMFSLFLFICYQYLSMNIFMYICKNTCSIVCKCM